jgi:hypothetical protein
MYVEGNKETGSLFRFLISILSIYLSSLPHSLFRINKICIYFSLSGGGGVGEELVSQNEPNVNGSLTRQ